MTRARFLAPMVLLALTFGSGDAWAQSRQEQQILQDLRILQEQVQQLRSAIAALAEQTKATNERLDRDKELAVKNHADDSATLGNVQTQVDGLASKMNLLTGQIGRLADELPSLKAGLEQQQKQLDKIAGMISAPIPTASGDVNAGTPPAPGTALPPSPGPAFISAKNYYMNGDNKAAASAFADFLHTFPEATTYGGEANFWLGMSQLNLGHNPEALTAFTAVVEKYQTSDRVSDAYYYQGECYRSMGNKPDALKAYEEVIRRFPGSNGAALALTKRYLVIK